MARTKYESQASFVKVGYGQVEPNHLSAQRTAQIYAQLPAAQGLKILENGQFVKYDYANGVVNTLTTNADAKGEWMLVFNEVKVYRDHETDCDFAMINENYVARVYSPGTPNRGYANARDYKGVVNAYEHDITATDDPFVIEQRGYEVKNEDDEVINILPYTPMPEKTTMVPRVFKTNVGDIFTTNMVNLDLEGDYKSYVGKILAPNADGILSLDVENPEMQWQIVKVYTLADRQPAVKVMRIA